ncbi:hypothetical protein ARTHRO9AX_10358 [Arthrobacter sp. 9AX]|nr:hypothetical protein ARTHRO9AX_10358 [Arthrobacter sp. 9AX]
MTHAEPGVRSGVLAAVRSHIFGCLSRVLAAWSREYIPLMLLSPVGGRLGLEEAPRARSEFSPSRKVILVGPAAAGGDARGLGRRSSPPAPLSTVRLPAEGRPGNRYSIPANAHTHLVGVRRKAADLPADGSETAWTRSRSLLFRASKRTRPVR